MKANVELFHPKAWEEISYSTYLGPFIDSKGNKYDLGVYKRTDEVEMASGTRSITSISEATTYSNEIPYYSSHDLGRLHIDICNNHLVNGETPILEWHKKREALIECYKRCLALGIFEETSI